MNGVAARIALRYLISKKSHRAVNVISAVSLAGVAVATAAIVVVLSVFNGFADVAASQLSVSDPDLLVEPRRGKVFAAADSLARRLERLDAVAVAMPSLSERGLLVAGDRQLPVRFKGVDARYASVVDVDSMTVMGAFVSDSTGLGAAPAQLSIGVASQLGVRPGLSRPGLYVPRRLGRINPANPATAFRTAPLSVTAVTQVGQMEADADRIIIPIADARYLLQYDGGEASAIEVALRADADAGDAAAAVAAELGDGYEVLPREAQHRESMRMISIEKWITFLMLGFILVIAAFNIVSTLSLMVLEKREDMRTLRYLGAGRAVTRGVFMWQGALITLAGAAIGMAGGVALSLAQQWGRFIRLGGDPSKMTIDVYPVRVEVTDILAVAGVAVAVAALTSLSTLIFTKTSCRQ